MNVLLDANVLIALGTSDHVHHQRVERWFAGLTDGHATCPITQGALIRMIVQRGGTAAAALTVLGGITTHERHTFWPDAVGFEDITLSGVIGHRQVTDAYLAGLARHRAGTLATLDSGLAALHSDVAVLIPEDPPR